MSQNYSRVLFQMFSHESSWTTTKEQVKDRVPSRRVMFEVFDWERLKKDEKIGKVFLRERYIFLVGQDKLYVSFSNGQGKI